MMQEAIKYIKKGKIEELEKLLTQGYFTKNYSYDESGKEITNTEDKDR